MLEEKKETQHDEEEGAVVVDAWIQSLIGRDWEIFWKPDSGKPTVPTASTPSNSSFAKDAAIQNNLLPKTATSSADAAVTDTNPMAVAVKMESEHENCDLNPVESVRTMKLEQEEQTPSSLVTTTTTNNHEKQMKEKQQSPARKTAKSSKCKVEEEEDDEQEEHAEDWYAGHVLALDRKLTPVSSAATATTTVAAAMFRVRFVGEETVYEMVLTPDHVRPCARAWIKRSKALLDQQSQPQRRIVEQKQQQQQQQHTNRTTAAGSTAADATARSKNRSSVRRFGVNRNNQNNKRGSNNNKGKGRTKISKTNTAKSNNSCQESKDFQSWLDSLPPDTSMLQDREMLQQIQETVERYQFPAQRLDPVAAAAMASNPAAASILSQADDLDRIRQLLVGIQCQIYLRSRLAPIEPVDDADSDNEEDDDDEDDEEPTEDYVNYLTSCLKELESGCLWYYRCWELHYRIYNVATRTTSSTQTQPTFHQSKMSRSCLLEECLDHGRKTITTIALQDTSLEASIKRKRQLPSEHTILTTLPLDGNKNKRKTPPPPPSPHATRQVTSKRRRNKHGAAISSEFWYPEGDGDWLTMNEHLEPEDFLMSNTVKRLVERLAGVDTRWYSLCFAQMLKSLSCNIVTAFIKWERKSEFYLGERETLDVEQSDGETSEEESDEDDDEEEEEESADHGENRSSGKKRRRNSGKEAGRFVKYEEIMACVESAQSDRVLQNLDIAALQSRLEQKVNDINAFQARAWSTISSVLDNAPGSRLERESDETMRRLKSLLQYSNVKDSPVWNVEPIGRSGPSSLTRKVLENAIVYRNWILDLTYAESVRERVSFVDDVVSRLSKLPPLPLREGPLLDLCTDISTKLNSVTPRVQQLSNKCMDHVALFTRYQSLLMNRVTAESERTGLLTNSGAKSALEELQAVPVVSVAEEMLAVRLDVLAWESRAKLILTAARPPFPDLASLKQSLDLLMIGQSDTRLRLVKDLVSNAAVDAEIREFAMSEATLLCDALYQKTVELHRVASKWKERADSVLTALRVFAHPLAGERLMVPKSAAAVDLKRVQDLMDEYEGLDVDLQPWASTLERVHTDAVHWSSTVTTRLLDETSSFDDYHYVVNVLACNERPRGLIVYPTRQVVDMLDELLTWYFSAKKVAAEATSIDSHVNQVLAEGLEILQMYSERRQQVSGSLVIAQSQIMDLILAETPGSRKQLRAISTGKLESNDLSLALLVRIIDGSRDKKEGYPMLFLLHVAWRYLVKEFVSNYAAKRPKSDLSFRRAKELKMLEPTDVECESIELPMNRLERNPELLTFEELCKEAEQMESKTRELLAAAKPVLRECIRKESRVRDHLSQLKDLQLRFKAATSDLPGLVLDAELEQLLDQEIKLFGWLVRTFQYKVLQSSPMADNEGGDYVKHINPSEYKIPWEALVKFYEALPSPEREIGEFAYVVLKVKELHESASKWQKEVSNFTPISLRGGKRRSLVTSPLKGQSDTCELVDGPLAKANFEKLVELCQDRILEKVIMPRETAIRELLESSKQFELKLHQLLGEDYEGECPDRAPYPIADSLVDENGIFLLFRLTGSPLFFHLKSYLASISHVANDILADTPGKATFDWIRDAVQWIESIHGSVSRDGYLPGKPVSSKLVIQKKDAKRLLDEGESILLNLPEDLRKTLSKHKIYVSLTKDRRLIVKSKKGGAHHAIGSTAIRWCPILLESLKADLSRAEQWETEMKEILEESNATFDQFEGIVENNDTTTCFHRYRDDIANMLDEGCELVVLPSKSIVDNAKSCLKRLEEYLRENSSSEDALAYAEAMYTTGPAAVENRFRLLDSIMGRRIMAASSDSRPSDIPIERTPFRNAGRELIERALLKGAALLGLSISEDDMSAHSKLRAWEIENAAFDLHQSLVAEYQMTPGYKETMRTLKRSFEDVGNILLCTRVLTGDIDAYTLVRMPTEELLHSTAIREKPLSQPVAAQIPLVSPTDENEKAGLAGGDSARNDISPTRQEPTDPPQSGSTTETIPKPSIKLQPVSQRVSKIADFVKTAPLPPPPPPPSLAASLLPTSLAAPSQPPVRTKDSSSSSKRLLSNCTGDDKFFFSLADTSIGFMVGLQLEDDAESELEGVMPSQLVEKGRLQIPEFTKFLKSKMESSRWTISCFRLVTYSDKDSREYKKFYKDYERRERIAMFNFGDINKVFLVTPKFHKAAKGLTFKNPICTYAVVLARNASA